MTLNIWMILAFFSFLLLFLVSSLFLFLSRTSMFKNLIKEYFANMSESLVKRINSENKINMHIIVSGLMAEKVELITKDKNSEEEKVIAIAEWISGNIPNRSKVADLLSDSGSADLFKNESVYLYYATRNGLCGGRASVFVEMLRYVNIPSKRYNICCFPERSQGHTCVQAYYNKSWHFFDVSYAGYFRKNGVILTFEEIIESAKNDEDYLSYLVVFDKTLDYSYVAGAPIDSCVKVENVKRMKSVYSKDKLTKASNYGFDNDCKGDCH